MKPLKKAEKACVKQYQDILYTEAHKSSYHHPMSLLDRAAQVAPYDALTGYKETIQEAGKTWSKRLEIDEDTMHTINTHLALLATYYPKEVKAHILQFIPQDSSHYNSGTYEERDILIHQIDTVNQIIVLKNHERIAFKDIYEIK